MPTEAMLTIGAFARQVELNPRTLRYDERIGVLTPAGRTDAGYRLYTERDAARLAFIRRAQALRLSLTEIAGIMAVRDTGIAPCRHVRAVAQAKVAEIDARIAELQALRGALTRLTERTSAVEDSCLGGSAVCLAVEDTPVRTP